MNDYKIINIQDAVNSSDVPSLGQVEALIIAGGDP
jgi:hypothetical protein